MNAVIFFSFYFSDDEKQKAKDQADLQSKIMPLNVVRLCFQAYLQDKNGQLTIMLPSVISNPIYDSSKYTRHDTLIKKN